MYFYKSCKFKCELLLQLFTVKSYIYHIKLYVYIYIYIYIYLSIHIGLLMNTV